jgi:hypothetical protein
MMRAAQGALWGLCSASLVGCATTTATLHPTPQAPLCDATANALIVWAPQWRKDQKEVPAREEAAAAGLRRFVSTANCFAKAELRRVDSVAPSAVYAELGKTQRPFAVVMGVEVQELGPVVKLLSSVALVEGGTEVVLRLAAFDASTAVEQRQFTVHWQSGGAGVVKGTATLPNDMLAALRAGFQPSSGVE